MTVADDRLPAAGAGSRPGPRARVGVFGIGLRRYWPQFAGLKERIEGYQRRVEERVGELGGDVVSAGLVDTAQERTRGGRPLRGRPGRPGPLPRGDLRDVEHGATRRSGGEDARRPARPAAHGRAGLRHVDTGEWLANCAACCVPEIAGAFTRAGIPYDTVAGTIDDDERAWEKIGSWVRAAGVARALRRSRIGFLGHVYPGMLDMYTDFTAVHAQLGAHVEVLEIDDLGARVAAATDERSRAKEAEIREMFAFADPSADPIAGPDRGRPARLVGARRRRPGQARRRLRAGRADLLLPRPRRQRGRAPRRRRDRRQLAADRARRARPRARPT